jgi:hypothetical protein
MDGCKLEEELLICAGGRLPHNLPFHAGHSISQDRQLQGPGDPWTPLNDSPKNLLSQTHNHNPTQHSNAHDDLCGCA